MAWTQPKTDWTISDRFNTSDFNRISENWRVLIQLVTSKLGYTPATMDTTIDTFSPGVAKWAPVEFNRLEKHLIDVTNAYIALIQEDWLTYEDFYGKGPKFEAGGRFVIYSELNRWEEAQEDLYARIEEVI